MRFDHAVFRRHTKTVRESVMVPAAFTAGLGVGLSFLIGPNIGAIAFVPVLILGVLRLCGQRLLKLMED